MGIQENLSLPVDMAENNCKKHFEFCLKMLFDNKNFENVIFTDQMKIQIESNIQIQAKKEGNQFHERLRPKPKCPHSVKNSYAAVYCWFYRALNKVCLNY